MYSDVEWFCQQFRMFRHTKYMYLPANVMKLNKNIKASVNLTSTNL